MKLYRRVCALLLWSLTFAVSANVDRLVIFGDSLSDTNNMYNLTSDLHRVIKQIPVIPDAPYFNGRFSNGPVWHEYFANMMMEKKSARVYAYGGAWARGILEHGSVFPPSLSPQVDKYILGHLFDRKDNHLFVILAGANDFLTKQNDVKRSSLEVGRRIEKEAQKLINVGAKNMIIALVPELSLTPLARNRNQVEYFHQATTMVNQAINVAAQKLRNKNSRLKLMVFDTAKALEKMVADKEQFGFTNVHDMCLHNDSELNNFVDLEPGLLAQFTGETYSGASLRHPALRMSVLHANQPEMTQICQHPEQYLFWDDVHPTTATHKIVAKMMSDAWHKLT